MFTFRPLSERDLPLVREWLARPHVAEWWSGDMWLYDDGTRQYIAELDADPFAYLQVYVGQPGVLGTDQFIGDIANVGRGLGTQLMREVADLVFLDPNVARIQVDPAPDNARAIRCYEKAGFRRDRTITTVDGPALLMTLSRS